LFLFAPTVFAEQITNFDKAVKVSGYESAQDIEIPAIPEAMLASDADAIEIVESAIQITDKNQSILALTGNDQLLDFCKTDNECNIFIAHWKKLLTVNGMKITKVEKGDGFAKVQYDGNGYVVRDFCGENNLMFKPQDKKAIKANMLKIGKAINATDLELIAAYKVNITNMHPTYKLYYLTKKAKREESEVQIRTIKNDVFKFDEFKKVGVNVVQTYKDFFMVYIDHQITVPYRLAMTMEDIKLKYKDAKEFFEKDNIKVMFYEIGVMGPEYQDIAKYYLNMAIRWK
jgi:hypothetical protein